MKDGPPDRSKSFEGFLIASADEINGMGDVAGDTIGAAGINKEKQTGGVGGVERDARARRSRAREAHRRQPLHTPEKKERVGPVAWKQGRERPNFRLRNGLSPLRSMCFFARDPCPACRQSADAAGR